MSITKIFINKIREIDRERLNMLAEKIAKKNNKSVSYVKKDMIKNFLKYKIGYTDYFKSDYINLTEEQKKDFLTSKNFINVIAYLNPRQYRILTLDKIVFNNIMKDYLKRDYLDLRIATTKEIEKFLKGKTTVFAKPTTDFGGHNIEKITVKDIKSVNQLHQKLLENHQYLLENAIIQHKLVQKINPYAVNALRLITLLKDGEAHIIGNTFRIGLDENHAIQCRDTYMRLTEDGTPACKFVDDDGITYDKHPLTGFDFNSIKKIPYVPEAIEMVKKAALLIPDLRYIGWDVAITDNGPLIIEGNEFPSYGLIQNHMLNPKNPGHLKQIRDVIGEEEFKKIKL